MVGHALTAVLRFEPRLELARKYDLREAVCGRALMHALNQAIHARAIVLDADEEVGLEGEKEMPDILRAIVVEELARHIAPAGRPRDHPAHDVHQHRQARTLVAADR